jgi:hypothetical protein
VETVQLPRTQSVPLRYSRSCLLEIDTKVWSMLHCAPAHHFLVPISSVQKALFSPALRLSQLRTALDHTNVLVTVVLDSVCFCVGHSIVCSCLSGGSLRLSHVIPLWSLSLPIQVLREYPLHWVGVSSVGFHLNLGQDGATLLAPSELPYTLRNVSECVWQLRHLELECVWQRSGARLKRVYEAFSYVYIYNEDTCIVVCGHM